MIAEIVINGILIVFGIISALVLDFKRADVPKEIILVHIAVAFASTCM